MDRPNTEFSLQGMRITCAQCNLRELCLPYGLSAQDIDYIDDLVGMRRSIGRRQPLYRAGDRFEAIYAIRSGSFKTDVLLEDGRNQVTGFQMTGEMLGMDGISGGAHSCSAIALETSEVCVIPFERLEQLSHEVAALQHNFHKLMSREIVYNHGLMAMLGTMNANERLAAFLLNFSQRLGLRGYSPAEFHLRMTREEIGSYLGLKIETVSRVFTKLQESGLIAVRLKHVRIIDLAGINKILSPHVPRPL